MVWRIEQEDELNRKKVKIALRVIFPHMKDIQWAVSRLTETELTHLMTHFKHSDCLTPVLAARVCQAYKDICKWNLVDRSGNLANKPLSHVKDTIYFS